MSQMKNNFFVVRVERCLIFVDFVICFVRSTAWDGGNFFAEILIFEFFKRFSHRGILRRLIVRIKNFNGFHASLCGIMHRLFCIRRTLIPLRVSRHNRTEVDSLQK